MDKVHVRPKGALNSLTNLVCAHGRAALLGVFGVASLASLTGSLNALAPSQIKASVSRPHAATSVFIGKPGLSMTKQHKPFLHYASLNSSITVTEGGPNYGPNVATFTLQSTLDKNNNQYYEENSRHFVYFDPGSSSWVFGNLLDWPAGGVPSAFSASGSYSGGPVGLTYVPNPEQPAGFWLTVTP